MTRPVKTHLAAALDAVLKYGDGKQLAAHIGIPQESLSRIRKGLSNAIHPDLFRRIVDFYADDQDTKCILIRARLRDELPESAGDLTVHIAPAVTRLRDEGTPSFLAMLDEIAVRGLGDPATLGLVTYIHENLREG